MGAVCGSASGRRRIRSAVVESSRSRAILGTAGGGDEDRHAQYAHHHVECAGELLSEIVAVDRVGAARLVEWIRIFR